ncbi:MAG: HD domain-containing protein, partial [Desulfobacterales bacterium]
MYKKLHREKTDEAVVDERLLPQRSERFKRQIEFILEVDKLKKILRRTTLLDRSRQENSAEHSWHIALIVLVLSEYAEEDNLDLLQVIKLLLAHD